MGEKNASAVRYAAFISYRHHPEDRRWAKWVLEELESYRTPRALVRRGFARRIGRLYRDEDENPASSELGAQIEEALAASDNLIVVASPHTPGSRWIEREILRFQEMGKGDRILTLLIDGDPAGSYPAPLLRNPDSEPIASDVRPRPDESLSSLKRKAKLRLAAALLGCSFDDLMRRDQRRSRRRIQIITAATLLLIMFGSVAWLTLTRDSEISRIEVLAATVEARPYVSSAQKAAAVFRALPQVDWRLVGLPTHATDVIGPVARRGAVSVISMPVAVGHPSAISEASGVLSIGTDTGVVLTLSGSELKTRLLTNDCSENELNLKHCAVTSIASRNGKIAAGFKKGKLAIIYEDSHASEYILSSLAIDEILWLDHNTIFASDSSGTIFSIKGKELEIISKGGGTVSRLLARDERQVVVLRVDGKIETLATDTGRLTLVERSSRAIRDGGWMRGDLMTVEMSKAGAFSDESHNSVVVLHQKQGNRVFNVKNGLPETFADGVRFRPTKNTFLTRSGTTIWEVEPFTGISRNFKIDFEDLFSSDQTSQLFFRGALVESQDESFIYFLTDYHVIIVNNQILNQINRIISSKSMIRAKLCAAGFGELFRGKNIPGNPC